MSDAAAASVTQPSIGVTLPAHNPAKVKETTGLVNRLCVLTDRLDDAVAVVTGANTGLGKATAGELARRGAKVVLACRSEARARVAVDDLVATYGADNPKHLTADLARKSMAQVMTPVTKEQFEVEVLDLASLQSVRDFARRVTEKHPQLHLLVANAGVFTPHYSHTQDGFETTIGVNHLGHFLLVDLLLPALKAAAPSRVIILSSWLHPFGTLVKPDLQLTKATFSATKAYSQSKLANVMHARELAKRLAAEDTPAGVTVVAVNPGAVKTDLARNIENVAMRGLTKVMSVGMVSPWVGAQTTIYCVLSRQVQSGAYYANCAQTMISEEAGHPTTCAWLYDKSAEMVAPNYKQAQPPEVTGAAETTPAT